MSLFCRCVIEPDVLIYGLEYLTEGKPNRSGLYGNMGHGISDFGIVCSLRLGGIQKSRQY